LSIDKNSEIVIYHVLIELINNTIKHAKAKNINIDFNKIGKYIDLVYKDDGLGFDLKQTIQDKKGLGLSNVLNRMKTIESTYHFESYPQKGIIFSFRILTN
jgi:signal transduction histidine kinase